MTYAEGDQKNIVKSEITGITVYPKGAVINREASVNLVKGFNTVVVNNLTTTVDPNTIQVGGEGNFEILSMKFEFDYPNRAHKSKRVEIIEDSLQALGDVQFLLGKERQALDEEYSMILINNSLRGSNGISVSQIEEMADYYRKRFQNIAELKLNNKKKLDSIKIEQQRLEYVLSRIEDGKDKRVGRVIVEINSKQVMKALLKCSFYTPQASWTPIYNVKAVSGKDEIEVDYNALVNQTTGVEWEDVKLELSTTKPNLNNQKPEMHPWYLDYYSSRSLVQYQNKLIDKGNTSVKQTVSEEDFKNMAVRSATDVAKNTAGVYAADGSGNLNIRGARNDANYYYIDGMKVLGSSSLPTSYNSYPERTYKPAPPKYAKGELVFNALNTSYDILNTYSIPSQLNAKQVFIKQISIPVSFSHYSVPSQERESFLTAAIPDWGAYDLIPGNATLFYNNTYVGQTFVLTHTLDDTLQVSLGRDQSVVVEQKKISGLSTTKKSGGNIKKKMIYEISARNNGKSDVEIVIYDRVPISKRKEIVVDVKDIAEAEYDEETGILKWKKVIKSGEQLDWRIEYDVKYPKGKIVNL